MLSHFSILFTTFVVFSVFSRSRLHQRNKKEEKKQMYRGKLCVHTGTHSFYAILHLLLLTESYIIS